MLYIVRKKYGITTVCLRTSSVFSFYTETFPDFLDGSFS